MAGFKARARALDMLGRQQISGIPTSISELFKNAYDAYADNVVLDFFRKENLVVLRDDGFGMTRNDFESKWLTIGTESKVDSRFGNRKNIDIPDGKAPRAIMGEKGIGRLAIAMIGSQVLIVTRAKRKNVLDNYVVSFINWRLFEQPGLNLEDIQIPIKEFANSPSQQDLVDIIHESRQNTRSLQDKIEPDVLSVILDELTQFSELQFTKLERKLTAPCESNNEYHGTRFYIYPASDMLPKSLESNGIDQDAPDMTKMLIGFTDSVFTNHENIPLKTYFRDHKYPETYDDVIADTNFFSESEIEQCDHFFHGSFDANGQFTAKKIKIFGKEQPDIYNIPWLKSNGRPTQCGPFELIVAEIQGNSSESSLTKDIHAQLDAKLYLFGGLYVYKDGIRILPYGNNKHDFLNIEYRRSKHAGKYHWSYRRLIGAVRLTTGANDAIKEKAGREGFQNNAAFSEMREILMNFFIQTASDFFNNDGAYADYWLKTKNDNEQRDALLKKEAEKQKTKRVKFTNELYAIIEALDNNSLETECTKILTELKHQLSSIDETQNKEHAATLLIDIEKQANTALANIKSTFALSKPRGISPQKKDEHLFQYYKSAMTERVNPTLDATQRQIVEITNEKTRLAKLEINRRLRIESTLSQASKDARKQIETQVLTTDNLLSKVQESVQHSTTSHAKAIRKVIRDNEFLLGQTNFQHMSEEEIYDWRMNVENNLISTLENGKQELEIIQTLLDNVKWVKEDNGKVSSYIDVLEANGHL